MKSGSRFWKAEIRAETEALARSLEAVDPEAFAVALRDEVLHRLDSFERGVSAYRGHAYRGRRDDEPAALWAEGSSRLLDYGTAGTGVPLLLVPSLINRAYVLDIAPGRSLVRFLAGQGFRPFLLDWGAPTGAERDFTLTDYVAGRLDRALDAVLAESGRRPGVIGYCMGGLLALALATRRPADVGGLALLATPFDFHAEGPQAVIRNRMLAAQADWIVDACGVLPVDVLQALFAAVDPFGIHRKFQAFARLEASSPAAAEFVALEDWLNDGVPLAGPVARECLGGWYADNTPAAGKWLIDGAPVLPAHATMPSLLMVPAKDRIVPPATALPLAEVLPDVDCRTVPAGHIGMVAGRGGRALLFEPLAGWLHGTL